MKNYIVYSESGEMLRRFDTQEEAIEWVEKTIADWRSQGSRRVPAYRVCYNGTRSIEVYNSLAA